MSYNWAPYQGASYCIGSPQSGSVALSAYLSERFPTSYLGNIYSCRNIVGGSGRSHHAEGRAVDQMHPPTSPSISYEMVKLLGPHGQRLGIDHIIANKQPWASGRGQPVSFAAGYPSGKVYKGLHPHKDHAHIGLTRVASKTLTLATIRFVLDPIAETPVEEEEDMFIAAKGTDEHEKYGWPDEGPRVEYYQHIMRRLNPSYDPSKGGWGNANSAQFAAELVKYSPGKPVIGPGERAAFEVLIAERFGK